MYLSQKHLTRRTILKGVGAAIALPLLDAMNPAATAWAQTAAGSTPKRFAFIGFPHGAIHFHDDDLYDCEWVTDFTYTVPDGLRSGRGLEGRQHRLEERQGNRGAHALQHRAP